MKAKLFMKENFFTKAKMFMKKIAQKCKNSLKEKIVHEGKKIFFRKKIIIFKSQRVTA